MYASLYHSLLLGLLALRAHALPQSNSQVNTTAGADYFTFDKLVSARLLELFPKKLPNMQLKSVVAAPWEEASNKAEDFLRVIITYYDEDKQQFMKTVHDPWMPASWSEPYVTDNTWSNAKPFRWQDVSSTLHEQLDALENEGIIRKYENVTLQKLRVDFNAQNGQIYWIWEESSEPQRKFWQGDIDRKAYWALDGDAGHLIPQQSNTKNDSDVEDITAVS